ncbi:MAG: PEP-CTERM sorting domain-containing protein [Planctomycetes bacterium]|nr:PEP-CTERM sorting domain-containing protein [Planctomycetota bacterium]
MGVTAQGDTIYCTPSGQDTTVRQNGSLAWSGNNPINVGFYDSSLGMFVGVFVFELPDLAGLDLTGADLTMTVSDSSWGASLSADLYGVRWNSSDTVLASDYSGGTLLQEAYAIKVSGNPAPANTREVSTDATGDANLLDWLLSLYTDGAQAGNYAFLRVSNNVEITSGSNTFLEFQGAETATPPQLTIETVVPEPATMALLGLGVVGLVVRKQRVRKA